ncbi:helix-turn-helix transcriptional regulator [Agromyces intestinalis]|uniref:Helix-turn-helix transcriptional regulator n=1 Tax=Agromyces intestinalis TaxID=2592652 RepID=A0A5C1YIF8_9MICO|nr:helix-turn-helix transcriptional regulator [Agromyces intestinalis]QEO14899.1 helix-turn-helix transcriptional regulator [Agromyces intestinalis]
MASITWHPSAERPRRRALWREAVGALLRQERLEQQRTLADVAREAGVSVQHLSEVERGRKEASSEVLGAVGEALGLDLADLAAGVARMLTTDRRMAEARGRVIVLPTSVDLGVLPSQISPGTPSALLAA